ncbi:MAG: RES family NAD+ phosphorylase [Flavobacteriales bacterium]|nr:RES family NAD+ phosphorylase [Flavobacteriales bacterium]MDG2245720.1 RES family NAD+ phosphorylase [Flavobacteriales bacterium]
MRLFRLTKEKYAHDFSGKGAALFGNRWNSKGVEMIYTAESRALAMAEVAVHLSLGTLPNDYVMVELSISGNTKMGEISSAKLPERWKTNPPIHATQILGDAFISANEFGILKVPSAVVAGDSNYLINPHHPAGKKLKLVEISTFEFDKRLFK